MPIFIVLVLLPFSASATTYYVSRADGNDNYNGLYPTYQGGSDGPWLTLAKSVSDVSSGDTVYLRAGTWNEKLEIEYKAYTNTTTWARYPSDPAGSVILNGTNLERNQYEDGIVWIHRSSNVRIDGLKVIHAYKTGIAVWGPSGSNHNLEILNCITNNTGQAGIETWYVDGCLIRGNTIYNANIGTMAFGDPSTPWGYEETLSITTSTNVEVSYNTLYGSNRAPSAIGGEGLNVKHGCSYVYVHHNYVDQARPDGQESDRYCMGVDGWTDQFGDTHHIYFYNNIVKSGSWGIQFNSEEGGYTHHIYAWNNIISHIGHSWRMHGGGIGFPPYGGSPGLCEHTYWWNNIIYDSYYGAYFNKEEIGAPIEVRNNIFYNSAVADIQWGASPQGVITFDHNLFSTTDPKFVNAGAGNFHLQSDSPAIDTGVAIPNVTDDFDGIPRPQGVAYDIGAYEYGGSPSNCTGTCKTNPCNTYNNCTTGSGTCSAGYCCSGSCTTIPACTENDWIYSDGPCQPDNTTTRTWTKTGACEGGVMHPTTEIVSCTYIPQTNHTYYVDATTGNDANNCSQALNPSTPKRTVNSVMSCNPGAGEIVKFRGTFTQGIYPTRSGEVLYPFQPIQGVSGSVVTFSQPVSGLNPSTDYVTVYNSRKGNSGAFAVVSFSGNSVTVDTSFLPLGNFITETASDPGDLHGAILRPIHFTAWDKQNPPIFNTQYQTFHSNCKSVVMISYLHSISGENHQVWPALELDCIDLTPSDYIIFDHIEVENAATALAVEARNFQTNYDIIQHNNIHDTGYQGLASDEGIYFGCAYQPGWHHDYVQIMYNKVGPHRFTTGVIGDGIEIKPSAHNATVWGNEIVGIVCQGCDDAPIKTSGTNTVISNNYIHGISPIEYRGCGISVLDDYPDDPTGGASGAIVTNNIIANVKGVGIRVLDASDVKILNNVIYNILPEPESVPGWVPAWEEENWGIGIRNWQGATENIVIKNNIVHSAHIGIGRHIWSNDYPVSIDSDYNIVYNTTYPFRGTITQNTNDLLTNPGFVNPSGGDFHLQSSSPAIDNGTDAGVAIDFDSVSRPKGVAYDIGAFEYADCGPVPGDLNGDCSVTILDLAMIALDFGRRSGFDPRSDTDGSNEIDVYDLVFVASRFT